MDKHRCADSLKNHVSIRFGPRWEFWPEKEHAWIMRHLEHDSETMTPYMAFVAVIDFCPFCGVKLLDLRGDTPC